MSRWCPSFSPSLFQPPVLLILALSTFIVGGATIWAHAPAEPPSAAADSLRINKSKRLLKVYVDGDVDVRYRVALSLDPTGPKRVQGDRRVPEGRYQVAFHVPGSIAHKALYVSYPNARDRRHARRRQRKPGGAIEIHGLHWSMAWMGRLHQLFNYTLGCVAVTNSQIDHLYRAVPDGTPVRIVPGRGKPGGITLPESAHVLVR
jgi:murein L,D-transpeptidase YafK